jgi:hypothetical protein
MRNSRIPITVFLVAAALTTSALASAAWYRVDTGTGAGNYGGGGQGCSVQSSGQFSGTNVWLCPVADNSGISSYSSGTVYFTNSNATQPASACVAFFNQTGGSCSNTSNNNCPNHGVCSFNMNVSAWQNFGSHFKYAAFDNMSVGALMSGYVINTTP